MTANATTGLVCASTADGLIHTYYPVETVPAHGAGAKAFVAPVDGSSAVDRVGNDQPYDGETTMSSTSRPVAAFGRYRWLTGRVVDCTDALAIGRADNEWLRFERRRPSVINAAANRGDYDEAEKSGPSRHVTLSTSLDWKVLITYRQQLAVFDVSPVDLIEGPVPGLNYGGAVPPTRAAFELAGIHNSPTNLSAAENSHDGDGDSGNLPTGCSSTSASSGGKPGGREILLPPPGALLWTVKASNTIVTASMSGNGRAIAYVIAGEGEGVPYPYGARTYVRDWNDGAAPAAPIAPGRPDSASRPTPSRRSPQKNGSISTSPDASNIGVIYKPGPFLNHSAPVTRVSFRGLGLNNSTLYSSSDMSSSEDGEEGNDLLLTCCRRDNSCRVFSQNSWKQLLQWNSPPFSRADWVQGITAANLGDLDVAPARKKGAAGSKTESQPGSSPASRRPSASSEGGGSGGINRHLLGEDGSSQPFSSLPSHPTPSSNAGAWISELTFRGGFPALRLSRLSYLKSGSDDAAPAHFESVAAILPPGALSAEAVLGGQCESEEDYVMAVQGIWCAWDPWECGRGGNQISIGDDDLAGSALALLGGAPASSLNGGGLASLGTGHLGGSHAPPSELRIVSSHIVPGKVVMMEFPLWGDRELGALELGSPCRYLVSLPGYAEDSGGDTYSFEKADQKDVKLLSCWLEFQSSHISASVSGDGLTISLTWWRKGSMNIVPMASSQTLVHHKANGATEAPMTRVSSLFESMSSASSLDSDLSHASFAGIDDDDDEHEGPRRFRDYSMTPLPLSLPPLLLPSSTSTPTKSPSGSLGSQGDSVEALSWWPGENYGEPPRLLVITISGTVVVYEMPPPWSALEPPMPVYDPFSGSVGSSLASGFTSPGTAGARGDDESDDGGNASDNESETKEYEVRLQPHPDFGIGLRLEAQARGMPAVAGSFKKHPLSGGRLPAERTGEISIGDELLSVNGVSLEGLSFDDIIGQVRDVGTQARGGPLTMKFRPVVRRRHGSRAINSAASGLSSDGTGPRRTIFGTASREELEGHTKLDHLHTMPSTDERARVDDDEGGNARTIIVGADSEVQQAFGRIIGLVRNAIPPLNDSAQICRPILILPWHYGVCARAPGKSESRSAVMIVTAESTTLHVSRLELPDTCSVSPEGAKFSNLGTLRLDSVDSMCSKDENESLRSIQSLSLVKTPTTGWCLAATDSMGDVFLIFVDIVETGGVDADAALHGNESYSRLRATFRQYNIFTCDNQSLSSSGGGYDFVLQVSAIDLIATMPRGGEGGGEVTIWSALPNCVPEEVIEASNAANGNYTAIRVSHGGGNKDEPVLDFRWVASGCLDAFPWLVTFSSSSAVVHRRPGRQLRWIAVAELTYASPFQSSNLFRLSGPSAKIDPIGRKALCTTISPADAFPHLLSALRIAVTVSDEKDFLRSDWHPDSILASICTEERGAYIALTRSVRGLFRWLSLWMSPDAAARPQWISPFPLGIAQFGAVNEKVPVSDSDGDLHVDSSKSATALMASLSLTPREKNPPHTEEDVLLFDLQAALRTEQNRTEVQVDNAHTKKVSKEFKLAMGAGGAISECDTSEKIESRIPLPDPLKSLSRDELHFLWAMGKLNQKPPQCSKLDEYAQLTAFCAALMRSIQGDQPTDVGNTGAAYPQSTRADRQFVIKKSSSVHTTQEKAKPPVIASAGCLAALVSDSQSELLTSLRKTNEKLDWPTTRSLGVPFWLRSNDALRTVAEEIAQDLFKKKRDVMECALYYVATHNMRSLRNFAAADQSDSGRTFFKFITQHDFSSQRGRKAAEKNAYSLLRKRKYGIAAGFFLLAEPPMLKSALEVIVTQMEDLSLAFMIARLVESSRSSSSSEGGPPGLDGLNLGEFGGGGGFATGGFGNPVVGMNNSPSNDVCFKDWEPKLCEGTRDLLTVRGLFMAKDDQFLEATQQLWLGRQNKAALCIAHFPVVDNDVVVPPVFDAASMEGKRYVCANDRVLAKSNNVIDFLSAPFLLKRMKTTERVRWTSALLVSRAMMRRGIELSSLRSLVQAMELPNAANDNSVQEPDDNEDSKHLPVQAQKVDQSPATGAAPEPEVTDGVVQSSIFDSFDAAPRKSGKRSLAGVASTTSIIASLTDNVVASRPKQDEVNSTPVPSLWKEWRDHYLAESVARRLLREIATTAARFEGEVLIPPMNRFRRHVHPLITHDAAHVLQYRCQGDAILNDAEKCLCEMADMCKVQKSVIIEHALNLLACPSQQKRIVFAVLLHCLMGRYDLAEDVVRNVSQDQIRKCESFAYANDDLIYNRKTRHHASSQYIRRHASGVSLQLELCLWLHHGGVFAMSGAAAKEAIIAVRSGYLVAGWGRCHESLETMLKNEPDCQMDQDMGRQLWSSMKIISNYEESSPGANGPSSGGWEFLVDCQRNEASAMLRDTMPGTFLIRPHAEDHGVFSLSFRTNLTPTDESHENSIKGESAEPDEQATSGTSVEASNDQSPPKPATSPPRPPSSRPVKKDDIVQHAIVRLSDAGFRCGSFGPFASLIKLLESVSSSLPFDLRFDQPPVQGIIRDKTSAPSPNSVFIRKLALHSKTENYQWNRRTREDSIAKATEMSEEKNHDGEESAQRQEMQFSLKMRFGSFSQLLVLTEIRKQLSAVAAGDFEDRHIVESSWQSSGQPIGSQVGPDDDFQEGLSDDSFDIGEEEVCATASRILRPLLCWCRTLETSLVHEISPGVSQGEPAPIDAGAISTEIEGASSDFGSCIDAGDTEIRRMIQPESGVEFRTLRVGEGNNSSIVVMFNRKEAIAWLVSSEAEQDEAGAAARLEKMEQRRVIEQIDLNELSVGKSHGDSQGHEKDIRYRFVDPWEVEVVETREGEVASATIGRGQYLTFNIGRIAKSCEQVQRSLGGLHLLALWSYAKGGICLTKALASVHPPWERDAGGDLQMKDGIVAEPTPYTNSIRQHLYRNMLFRRLKIPQRFLALLQVELLDLKDLTSPGASSSLTAYALLRLKRPGSGAPLTHKARTLDSACTQPQKIVKISGPNAPASWGSLVRLRFPLPEDVDCDGVSYDGDREALFKGAPSVLQLTVYEKKFMNDVALGGADVSLDGVASGGQLEEWVPLRSSKDGIIWFARIRLTLRFELMCLVEEISKGDSCPKSVGLTKIHALSKSGGAHEDTKGAKRSLSSPDFVQYLESMVY